MFREIKEKLVEFWERLRCFIDVEPYKNPVIRGNSKSDQFSDKIIREINSVMNQEKFTYQSGKTLIPTKYVVFISAEDNIEWDGIKRQGLERKLTDNLRKYLRPLSSQATLMPHNYDVKIKVDQNLNLQKNEIKVIHQWEERQASIEVCINGTFYSTKFKNNDEKDAANIFVPSPITVKTLNNDNNEEITLISPIYSKQNYIIEVWRNGICLEKIPFIDKEFTVGRGSPTISVDIQLKGDSEVSRFHGTLKRAVDKKIFFEVKGKKPVITSGKFICYGEQVPVFVGQDIKIGSYSLCLRN